MPRHVNFLLRITCQKILFRGFGTNFTNRPIWGLHVLNRGGSIAPWFGGRSIGVCSRSATNRWIDSMVTPSAIFTVAYALIAFSKIPKSLIALMGAALMVLLGSLDSEHAFEHV